jgi:hypothetical protein
MKHPPPIAPKPPTVSAHTEQMRLVSRIQEVVDSDRVHSMRAWTREAGLSDGYLGSLLTRLRHLPDADIRRDELVRLARAARVSLTWLATGEGHPDSRELPSPTDPAYPHRGRAVGLAHLAGVEPRAVAAVRALELPPNATDPPVWAWLEAMLREQRAILDPLAAATAARPAPPAPSPAERGKRR